MRGFRIFLAALLLALSPAALAEIAVYRDAPVSYVGANIMTLNVDGDVLDQTAGGFLFRLGGMIDPHFGAEVRLARGFWHETQRFPGTRVQVDVDHVAGLYGSARLPFDVPLIELPLVDKLFVHALLGVADVQLRSEINTCAVGCTTQVSHDSATDLSWGVGMGMELKLPKIELPVLNSPRRIGLSLEYMNYGAKYDIDLTGVEAGLMVFF